MSMQNLIEGLRIIEANRSRGFFAGPRTPALIASAEAALTGMFPPTYREFLQRLGAGSFGAFEFFGVVDDNFCDSEVPNGIWLTLRERIDSNLPGNVVVIGSTGGGAYYCLEMSENAQETPVFIYHPGIRAKHRQQQKSEIVADDFGEFFLNQISRQL